MSRAGRRRAVQQGHNPLGWMFTFSDVVTLIFTFFVMLLALRQPDLVKYRVAFGALAQPGAAAQAPAPTVAQSMPETPAEGQPQEGLRQSPPPTWSCPAACPAAPCSRGSTCARSPGARSSPWPMIFSSPPAAPGCPRPPWARYTRWLACSSPAAIP